MTEPPSKALQDPMRIRILAACSEGEITTKEFARAHRVSVRAANNHFRLLWEAGYIKRRKIEIRGLTRYVYRAALEPMVTDEEFSSLSMKARYKMSETVIRDLVKRAWKALQEGNIDDRDDSILFWFFMRLDDQGWNETIGVQRRAIEALYQIKLESEARLRLSGEIPIPTVAGLLGFEGAQKAAGPLQNLADYPGSDTDLSSN